MAMTGPINILFSAICVLALSCVPGAAETRNVATAAAFLDAYRDAAPGDRIVLEAGNYGSVRLEGGGGAPGQPVIIAARTSADPAQFSGLVLKEVSHVVVQGLLLDYTFTPKDELRAKPFVVESSRDVTLRGLIVDGDMAHDLNAASDGLPAGFGLTVARTDGLTLENSQIRRFWRGLSVRESKDLRITGNDLYAQRMDGMNFAQVENVLIEANTIRDFDRSTDKRDHADMIQFWTAYTTAPSRNITIRGNLLHSGTGRFTQSIFMGNELVQRGKAGEEMYYRNVTIENNLIINAHKHGIALGASIGVRIANNTLVHNPASDGDRNILALYRPQLGVIDASRDVRVENNIAAKFNLREGRDDWTMAGNITVQDAAVLKPNHYATLFIGMDAMDPGSFRPKPGGPLDGTGIGADVGRWQ